MPFMREKASSSELHGLMNDNSPMLSHGEDDGEDGYHHALPMHTNDDGADDPISSSTRGTMSCCSCGASSGLSLSRRSRGGLLSSSSSTGTGLRVFIFFFGLIAGLAVLFQYTKQPAWSFHSKTSSSGLNRIAQWGPAPGKDVQGVQEIFLGNQRVAQRILIRDKTDREGLGSQLNHIKGSMILAKALEATFVLGDSYSHHHYSTSDMINGPIFRDPVTARPPVYVPLGQTCALSDHLPYEKRQEVIRGWCLGDQNDRRPMQRVGYSLAKRNCSIIIDDVGRDFYNDLSLCYTDVLRERLGGIDDRRNTRPDGSGDAGALTVGIHVRWGDTARSDNATEFRGSMPTASVNEIIHEAQKRFKRLDIRIAMESHNDHVLSGFEFDYTLIDSGDVMADLHALADNDLLLIGSSSFAVVVHMMAAPDGLTILDGNDRARKFPGTQRTFFGTFEAGFHPSMLDSLPQRFPELELA